MTSNKLTGLAWALGALTVALAVAGPIIAARLAGGLASFNTLGLSIVSGLPSLEFRLVGAWIVSRQPRNTIGWLLVGPSFAFSTTVLSNWRASLPASATLTPLNLLLLWLSSWTWWLLIGPLLLIPLLFPTGRLLSPRWRWVVALLVVGFAVCWLPRSSASLFGQNWPAWTSRFRPRVPAPLL